MAHPIYGSPYPRRGGLLSEEELASNKASQFIQDASARYIKSRAMALEAYLLDVAGRMIARGYSLEELELRQDATWPTFEKTETQFIVREELGAICVVRKGCMRSPLRLALRRIYRDWIRPYKVGDFVWGKR